MYLVMERNLDLEMRTVWTLQILVLLRVRR